ncbi:hypothetical protein ACK3YH_20670 [Aeromonas caviae]|uniref:hypothetical protein n=2 Tax=Aeromonas caviae TaxID=648 RepID=UPI00021989F9|nr:hypothetical protein [Aeromonas caviae]
MADNSVTEIPVTYDRYGRMNYHPDYHANHKKPWTSEDAQYLIENYDKVGPEEVSFTLERTIHTVMTYACSLRKNGKMPPVPANKPKHRRIGA